MERRRFLAAATGSLGGLSAMSQQMGMNQSGGNNGNENAIPRVKSPGELRGEMLYRQLAGTGQEVSAIGMGGFHLGKPGLGEAEAIRLVHAALDRGITFLDNAWDYNDGKSEVRVGKALAQSGYRDKAFLMTKIDGRTREAAARQIDESLSRLKTDHIDLIQHHEIIRFEDPDRVFSEGGAMEAVLEAKRAGKIRFIGFTGHKDPRVHLYMLEVAARHGFHFDTAQMPLNVMDAHYRSFAHMVVPRLIEQQIGVLGMKPMAGADGVILKSKTATALDCLQYALNLPTSVVITGIDSQKVLDQAFQAAKSFRVLSAETFSALIAKTEGVASSGQFELYKTSAHFDSTAKHPEWLGGETTRVKALAPQNT